MERAHRPLLGVKVFVDVRSKHANHSIAVSEELRKLGAVVLDKLLPTVTHIIFKDGSKTTESKASKFGAHVVNVSWVDSCKQANDRVPEHLHSIKSASTKKKQRSMQPKDFQEEVKQASDKLARVKKRRSDIQIPSPLTIVADRINVNNYLAAPRTPPAMQKRIDQLREKKTGSLSSARNAQSTSKMTPSRALKPIATNDLGMSPTLRPSQKEPSKIEHEDIISSERVYSQHDVIVPETPLHWNIKSAQTLQFSPTPDRRPNENSNMDLCTPRDQRYGMEVVPAALDLSGSMSPTLDWDQSIDSFLNVKLNALGEIFTPPTPQSDESAIAEVPQQDNKQSDIALTSHDKQAVSNTHCDGETPNRKVTRPTVTAEVSESPGDADRFSIKTKPRKSISGTTSNMGPPKTSVNNRRRSSFIPPKSTLSTVTVPEAKPANEAKQSDDSIVSNLLAAHSKAIKSTRTLLGNLSQNDSKSSLSKPENSNLFAAFSKLKPARRSTFLPPQKSGSGSQQLAADSQPSQEIPLFDQVVPTVKDSPTPAAKQSSSHVTVKKDKTEKSIITLSDSDCGEASPIAKQPEDNTTFTEKDTSLDIDAERDPRVSGKSSGMRKSRRSEAFIQPSDINTPDREKSINALSVSRRRSKANTTATLADGTPEANSSSSTSAANSSIKSRHRSSLGEPSPSLAPRRSRRTSVLPSVSEESIPKSLATNSTKSSKIKRKSEGGTAKFEVYKDRSESPVNGRPVSARKKRSLKGDQEVPNSSYNSVSSELTDFHSPVVKAKAKRRTSVASTALHQSPDTSNLSSVRSRQRRKSSVTPHRPAASSMVPSPVGESDSDDRPSKKRKTSAAVRNSSSNKNMPNEALNQINFSNKQEGRGRRYNSVSSQSELEDDALWMFNSVPSTPDRREGNCMDTEVPSTTKSPPVMKRTSQDETRTKQGSSNATSGKNRPVNLSNNMLGANNIVLTSLHSGDRSMVKSIVKSLGDYTISTEVNRKTTHVVCGDERRTMNVLRGISLGCWIVSVEWVFASLGAGEWLTNVDDYMMNSSFRGATLQRRQHIKSHSNKLFGTIGPVYVSNNTHPSKEDLTALIQINGGKVVKTRRAGKIVIGRECDISKNRKVIKEGWVLDCVISQRLLDCRPYKWRLSSESSSDNDDHETTCNIFSS